MTIIDADPRICCVKMDSLLNETSPKANLLKASWRNHPKTPQCSSELKWQSIGLGLLLVGGKLLGGKRLAVLYSNLLLGPAPRSTERGKWPPDC